MVRLARRVTLETEAYQVPQGRMEKLAPLGSWDHQGLLDPLGLQARDVPQNLDLRLKALGTSGC